MKRKLLISLLLVSILCVSLALVACQSVDAEVLDRMLADLKETYPATSITNESYNRSTVKIDFDDNGKMTEVKIVWTVEGSAAITVSDVDEENVRINIPTTRDSEIKYTLVGTLADKNSKAYTNKDGEPYAARFECTVQKTNASQNVGAEFNKTIVKNPTVDTPYVWGTYWGHEMFYFAGTIGDNDHNYATTHNYAEAVPVSLEAVEGGYYLYFMKDNVKTYINMTTYFPSHYSNPSGSTGFETDKTKLDGVLTIDEATGALRCATLTCENWSATLDYYFAIRSQYYGTVRVVDGQYLTYGEGENHSWKTNEPPMYLLSGETTIPAQETLTEAQILEQAFALGANEEMSGVIELTGVITEIGTTYTAYGTVKIQVADKTIECYKMVNNDDVKVSELKVGDKIKVCGVLRNFTKDATNKVEFDDGCRFTMIEAAPDQPITKPEDLVHAGTAADPFSVADADKYAKVLGNKKTEDPVYVKGIVTELQDPSQGEYNFNIIDAAGDTVKCIIYWTTSTQAPVNGDTVVVKGYLTQYNGTAEIAKKDDSNKPSIVSINGTDLTGPAPVDSDTILGQLRAAAVSAPVTTGSYKLVIWQGTLQKAIYATGALSGNYLATTEDIANAATVTVEEATGGFYLTVTVESAKKYVTVTANPNSSSGGGNISLTETATSVFTVNEDGLLTTGDWILGTYNNYNTISASNKSHFSSASVIDNSQFIVRIIPADTTITIPDGTIKAAASNEHATVTFTEPTDVDGVVTAKWYTTVKFTVAATEGFGIVSVKVGGQTITADANQVYTVTLIGDMEIEVRVKDTTAPAATNETFDFSSVTYGKTSAFSADEANTYFKDLDTEGKLTSVTTSFVYGKGGSSDAWANATNMLKVGKSNTAGQIVLTFQEGVKIEKVEISCFSYKNKTSNVKVNNSATQNAAAWNDAHTPTTLTFVLDTASNVITIDTSERVYMLGLTVYFADATTSAE